MCENSRPRVVTVALNPAIDYTITVDSLQPGTVHRARAGVIRAGGKAVNVATCLAEAGIPVAITGLFGQENAQPFTKLCARLPMLADHSHQLAGSTRVNVKLIDPARGQTTDVNTPGLVFTPDSAAEALDVLQARLRALLAAPSDVAWVIFSGSLPPGMPDNAYATLIRAVRAQSSARIALDSSGMALCAGLAACPDMVKPNRNELSEWAGQPLNTLVSVTTAALAVYHQYRIPQVIVSLGAEGALFLIDGVPYPMAAPAVSVTNTVGAGDAMVAGIVAAQSQGWGLEEMMRWVMEYVGRKIGRE